MSIDLKKMSSSLQILLVIASSGRLTLPAQSHKAEPDIDEPGV
jgi:hypothetical protein